MLPDYRRDNPYQKLLVDALAKLHVGVRFPRGYRRGLPLFRETWAQRTDVLHLHWLTPYIRGKGAVAQAVYSVKLWLDLLLVRLSGVKVVWTIHNRLSHEAKFPQQERLLQRALARLVHARIVHSASAAELLGGDLSLEPNRFTVIPHGHYRDAYGAPVPAAEAKQRLGLSASSRIFLYFGMIRSYKGVDDLIRVWKQIQTTPDDFLMIAGYTADKEYVRKLDSLATACSSIRLDIRSVPNSELPVLFGAADVVVLPFRQVLTSGSMLLAMSYSRPVIAPRFRELAETLQEAGALLYDAGATNAGLQKSLEAVLSRAVNIDSLSLETRKRCDNLDWSHIAKSTRACYAHALHRDA